MQQKDIRARFLQLTSLLIENFYSLAVVPNRVSWSNRHKIVNKTVFCSDVSPICNYIESTGNCNTVSKSNVGNSPHVQGMYGSWKTWKVLICYNSIFQAWKSMEFRCCFWKIMESHRKLACILWVKSIVDS